MVKVSIKDLEKQVTEDSKDALPPPVHQVMAGGPEQDLLILVDGRINYLAEGGGIAARMNIGIKNWRLPYWLIACYVIVMTNHIYAVPKLMPPELLAMFAVFLCGIGLVLLAMKQMI